MSENGQVRRVLTEAKSYVGAVGNRLKPGTLLKGRVDKHGYTRYCLFRDDGTPTTINAHRAIALGFHGPKPKKKAFALHWDDNPAHNHVSNVRWGTPKQNNKDALRNGKVPLGSKRATSKLTEEKVMEIRKRFPIEGKSLKTFGDEFGVGLHAIWQIIHYKTWRHV